MKCAPYDWIKQCRRRLKHNSYANLIWLINFLPSLCGFPLLNVKFNFLFWTIHTILLFYVYILGVIIYQMYSAKDFIDSINSFFNISAFILISVDSWWILRRRLVNEKMLYRQELNNLLEIARKNDDLIIENGRFHGDYEKMLRRIKIIVIMCYVFHFINEVLIFIPYRTLRMEEFSIASCVGLEPLDVSPNREVCMGQLALQELTSIVVVCSYDVSLLFLFSHTTAVFQVLYEEMINFSEMAKSCHKTAEDYDVIEARLSNIIDRHGLALRTVRKVEAIYSEAIGIGFGLDAISLCLFFVLPIEVILHFAPLIYHSLFIFFLYCFQGQRLTTASEKFEMAVYCCGWENLRVKERKQVLLMLKQAQKPVIVYAAKVIPIRLSTFATTMQSIYKFVTVFKV